MWKMGEEWWSSVLKRGCVWVKYTLNTMSLHKYTRVAKSQDGMEVKSMIDLVLVKKGMLHCEKCEGSERNGMRHLRTPCCTV